MSHSDQSVLHLIERAGAYSEIWIDSQVSAVGRYDSRAWSLEPDARPNRWTATTTPAQEALPGAKLAVQLWRTHRYRGLLRPLSVFPRAIAKAALRDEPSVLHAHFGPIAWEWLGLVRPWDVPLVVSFYGFDASRRKFTEPPWIARYRTLFDRTSAVIVEGPAMAQRLVDLGCDAAKIQIVRLPFSNVDLVSPAPMPKRWDAIMAGRFVEKKGFGLGVEAFAKALPKGQLLLVGSGPLEDELRRQVRHLGIGDRVTFSGPVPLQELAALFVESRVALFPSRTAGDGDGEGGAPLTLTLAQAVGTPVIVSDHDDLPWAAAGGTPIVSEGDVRALTGALRELHVAETQGRWQDQITRAREFVSREHGELLLISSREAIYDQVISE